jgi:hypothetical protein
MKENDFSPLVFMGAYAILLAVNLVIFLILYFSKSEKKIIFEYICYGLLALFLPLFFLVVRVIV